MKKETALDVLRRDIVKLEARRSEDLHLLKEQIHETYESLKPVNLIKGIFKNATASPEISTGLTKAAMGVTSGHDKPTGTFFELWSKRFMAHEAPRSPAPAVMMLTHDPRLNMPATASSSSSKNESQQPFVVTIGGAPPPVTASAPGTIAAGRGASLSTAQTLGSANNPIGQQSIFVPTGPPTKK